ncbi:MAG: hypothetical protein Q9224_006661, partial [Gallowayella concinna]
TKVGEIVGTMQPMSGVSEAAPRLAQAPYPKLVPELERRESKSVEKPPRESKSKETPEEKAQRRAERKRRKQTTGEDFSRSTDQLEEHSTSRAHEGKGAGLNGVVETRQKSPETEKPKPKRKKRKAEAPEDA